jgi:hypothetical protein
VNPGERGYMQVTVAPNELARCMQPEVVIDVDHTFQSGAPDPFSNDTAAVWTQCLTWSRPISGDSLGVAPDPFLNGKTLGEIVGSSQLGRKPPPDGDGKLCSECHFQGSARTYRPPILEGASGIIQPMDAISGRMTDPPEGRTWAGAAPDGWASRFVASPIKPDYLKAMFKQWLEDGARP